MTVKTVEGTVYATIPMQLYMMHSIKQPIIDSIETIFNPDASKIDKFKAARKLWKVYHSISKLPEPTLENTWHPNSHNLIILRDWLFKRCFLSKQRMGLVRQLINFAIIVIDFDPPWRWILDSLREEACKMEWQPKEYGRSGVVKYDWWGINEWEDNKREGERKRLEERKMEGINEDKNR